MTHIPDSLRLLVRERANLHCEYCLLNEKYTIKRHQVDHIEAEKHDGQTIESNLCLSCFDCNHFKGTDLTSIDPETKEITPLFHPRLDRWQDHFEFDGAIIKPRTAKGRVTVRFLLRFNDRKRVLERELLIAQGHYP